ncbi:cytochrome P450 72A15-like [Ananas comosus]|uniref:Cytochrome P450 72A15-like n=1 Tax=Ananas comosus TaxID=4615 RepID=A0A6P5GDJ1_ANACO|nr:cytochrome P450 72A15-like [Ananas comosus]
MGVGIEVEVESPWAWAWSSATVVVVVVVVVVGMAVLWGVPMVEWGLLRPRRLERALRAQGLRGSRYHPFAGDLPENARLNAAARSRPLPLSPSPHRIVPRVLPLSPSPHRIVPRVSPLFHQIMQLHGKISFTWFGPTPRVTITDPELVREVLSNKFGHFEKPSVSPLARLLADGLANYKGEKWARHRRILNPAFHLEKLKRMLPSFSTCCTELIARWENLVPSEGSSEIDVWPELQNFTGDVISRTAFGSSYQEGRRIFQLQSELAERLIQAFQYLFIPGYRFLPTKNNSRMKEIDGEIRSLLRGIIGKREKAIKVGEATNDDLLGLMLESNMRYFEENANSNLKMSTDEVIEECKLFYFAGQETTSVLLTWTMVALSMHPEWQARAREEVLQVFGNGRPDFEGLSRLKIVTMIFYEVLRLYPPVIFLNRKTYKEMKLGGITYPPGVTLMLLTIFLHHDPDIWGQDASEFRPERFAEGISKASNDQVAFFPFGWGPRICIGQSFALLEAKMGLSMILQRFTFELSPSYIHAPYTVITLHPQHGAQINFRRL